MAIYMWREEIPDTVMYEQPEGVIVTQNYYLYTGTVPESGVWTVQTMLKSTSNWVSHLSVQVNGTEQYNFQKAGADGWSSLLTQTFNWTVGDEVKLYVYHDLSGESAYIQQTKIYKDNNS